MTEKQETSHYENDVYVTAAQRSPQIYTPSTPQKKNKKERKKNVGALAVSLCLNFTAERSIMKSFLFVWFVFPSPSLKL